MTSNWIQSNEPGRERRETCSAVESLTIRAALRQILHDREFVFVHACSLCADRCIMC